MAACLAGLGGGVLAEGPQHGLAGRRVVAAQPAQGALRQLKGLHLGVGVGAGRAGPAVEQAELAESMPGRTKSMTPSESKPLDLQPDLAAGDQVALGAAGPLGQDALAPGVAAALQIGASRLSRSCRGR